MAGSGRRPWRPLSCAPRKNPSHPPSAKVDWTCRFPVPEFGIRSSSCGLPTSSSSLFASTPPSHRCRQPFGRKLVLSSVIDRHFVTRENGKPTIPSSAVLLAFLAEKLRSVVHDHRGDAAAHAGLKSLIVTRHHAEERDDRLVLRTLVARLPSDLRRDDRARQRYRRSSCTVPAVHHD